MGSCLSTASEASSPSSSAATPRSRKKRARRALGRSASFEAKSDEALRKIPGRMFLNGASGIASMFTQQGKKGTNQDAMIVWENFCARSDTVFCGVFDGHGPFGHMVARRVRDSLPLKLSSHLEVKVGNVRENISITTAGSMNSEDSLSLNLEEESRASADFEERDNYPEMFMGLKQSFLKAFKVMDKELRVHPNIDCFCSGTTAVTLLKQGQDLIIGNVGDSRAILGTRDQDDRLIAVQLTVDLKPNLPREAERIRRCKGRVFALQDEPEVARVWLPNNDSPGLAMARAFGDFCLKDFGLISVPDVSYRRITEKDKFIVLATDGVWDVLSNEEVVDIVASTQVRSYAARSLVEAAVRSWRIKYPTSKVDDCAVVCLFLNADESTSASSSKEACNSWSFNSTEADDNTELNPSIPTSLDRSGTVRSPVTVQGDNIEIEGVARVDTLLTLPRFVPDTKIKKAT
ncbi:probable protein phosphatase 2C 33 [Asparagus officinalis]|uniref:probable protein phosphatase 2C 33 n=1 Tax=Asparagus officinalis TaxID=4686 RepID=UPI00098E2CB9|nr:probable protein phosphatase 2C 33 [Asparagus officinalis]